MVRLFNPQGKKLRVFYKSLEWLFVVRFFSIIIHEAAHYYSFVLLGKGTADISFEIFIFTSFRQELNVWTIFFAGPWLFGAVHINSPFDPYVFVFEYCVFIFSGIVMQIIFIFWYSRKYRSKRFKFASLSFGLFAALLGAIQDMQVAYLIYGFDFLYYYFKFAQLLFLFLFYSGLTFLTGPFISRLYEKTRNEFTKHRGITYVTNKN